MPFSILFLILKLITLFCLEKTIKYKIQNKTFKLVDEDVGLFLTVFGKKELKVLCQQFAGVLQHAGVALEQVQTEWVMLKTHLYNKWV